MFNKIKYGILSLVIIGALNCQKAEQHIMITNVPKDISIDVPTEIPPGSVPLTSDFFKVQSGEVGFLLQQAPAIFSADDETMQRTFCTILPADVKAGEWALSPGSGNPILTFRDDKQRGRLHVLENDKPVLTYNYGMQLAPGVPEDRRRSTYIHPVNDLRGNSLTDDFPKDHYHHRGLSWMWPHVTIDGKDYNLWHIQGVKQIFEKWLAQEDGPVCATLGVKNAWRLDDRKVMDEWVWVRVFRATDIARVIDIRLTWKALEPIRLLGAEKKGYGGLCFRIAPRQQTIITTPAGIEESDSNQKRYPWADESGIFGSSSDFSGVAIFQHQTNPDFPAGWCLRHYGFLGVNWPGLEPFTVLPGKPLTMRFRIYVHNGDAGQGMVKEAYKVFKNSPILSLGR